MATGPLLYPSSIGKVELTGLVSGILAAKDLASDPDVVTFPEAGGDADLELAIPFLPVMDEVVVDAAGLRVVAQSAELELTAYTVSDGPGGQGSFLALPAPSRLRKVVVDAPSAATAALPERHLVVRAAEGMKPGPPGFADPPFSLSSPMFGAVFGGMAVTSVSGGYQLEFPAAGSAFPAAQGSAWLIQYATGHDATSLQPVAERVIVRRVTVDAAATDLALVIPGATAKDAPVPLWSHPGALLPAADEQEIIFTPLAQKHLAAALARLGTAAGPQTLPIPLRFTAAGGGAIRVVAKTLQARYVVRPADSEPVSLGLGGDWVPLELRAPAGRRPTATRMRLRARHLGRELNRGSGQPPVARSRAGLRVGASRLVATSLRCLPADRESIVSLASARVCALAVEAVEVVCELRADAAGAPGPLLAAPMVKQLLPPATPPPRPDWIEFELPSPGATFGVPATVWVTLRTNRGELRWFTGDSGEGRVSLDGGASWAAVDAALAATGTPLAQLFHAVDAPRPPVVDVLVGGSPAGSVGFEPVTGSPLEFVTASGLELPAPVVGAFATAAPGADGQAALALALFSRAAADLTVEELTLSYDPFAGRGG